MNPSGAQLRIGIHDQHLVAVGHSRQQPAEDLVERAGLAVPVADREHNLRACPPRRPGSVISTVIADYDDPVWRPGLLQQRSDRAADPGRLVMRRENRDHQGRRC